MNLTHTNEPDAVATVPQILARLILLQRGQELPDPKSMDANEDHKRAEVKVRDRAAFDAWLAAVGGRQADVTSGPCPDGSTLFYALTWNWHGEWRVSVELTETASIPATVLDADMVAGLEEIAAEPKPLVSGETIRQAEWIGKRYPDGVNYVAPRCSWVGGCDVELTGEQATLCGLHTEAQAFVDGHRAVSS